MKKIILGYAIGPLGTAIVSMISLPLLTWIYSAEDIGRISMLNIVIGFSILVFSLGLDQAYVREYYSEKNKSQLLRNCLSIGIYFLIFSIFLFAIINPSLMSEWLYGEPSIFLSFLTFFSIVFSFLSRFLSLILRMEERAFAYSMTQFLPKSFFLLLIMFIYFFDVERNKYSLISTNFLSLFFVFVIFLLYTKKDWINAIFLRVDVKKSKKYLLFGLPLMVSGFSFWGLTVVDKIFLRSMVSLSELGVYSVALSIAGFVSIFSGIFNTIWAPMIYKWIEEKRDLKEIDKISEHVLATIYFVVAFSGLLGWIIPYFLPLEYNEIHSLVILCILGPLFYMLSETTSIGISITKKTKYVMAASTLALVSNILGNFFLIPKLGGIGAALATAISFYLYYVVRTEFSVKVWRTIPRFKGYTLCLLMIVFSFCNEYFIEHIYILIFYWLMFGFFGFCFFYNSIKLALKMVVEYAFKYKSI